MNETTKIVTPDHHSHYHLCSMRCLSWSAIIFGAIVAVALGFLLNIFSLAVGLTAFPVDPEGKAQFAAWGFVGLVVLSIVSMFFSGWVAGLLGRNNCYKRKMGEFYGFGAWALSLIVTIFLVSQGNQFVSQKSYLIDRNVTPVQLTHEISTKVNEASAMMNKTTTVDKEKASTALGIVTFATFFLLFIGAISAAFGGRVGIRYHKNFAEKCPQCK